MELKDIAKHVDHTLLSITATWDQIKDILDLAVKMEAASACIPPCYVKQAVDYVGKSLKICTVIGFPNGYNTTATKVYEAKQAINEGAEEIDMVVNLCWVKDGKFDLVEEEIRSIRKATEGKILKVIIESNLLEKEDIIKLSRIVSATGADYIKTSTGFTGGGATVEAVTLMVGNVGSGTKVKASGGISSLEDAEQFLALGADRLGTSRILPMIDKALNN